MPPGTLAQMETAVCYGTLCIRAFPLGRNSVMGETSAILQHVNIKLVYLWIAALELFVLKIAV